MARVDTYRSILSNEGTMSGINTVIGEKETFLDNNAKLIPSDETTTAVTNMNWIAGHHTVKDLESLYNIPDFILSQESYADKISKTGQDALGQLWYVEDQKRIFQLINWEHRHEETGWALTNISAVKNIDGNVNVSYFNTNSYFNKSNDTDDFAYSKYYIKEKDNGWITSITMYGDGTYTYTTDGFHLNKSNTTYSYESKDSTSTFDVIDSINYNPSKDYPHQLAYNIKTVKVLSQSHHGGSIKGDFLTSASLSSTGTLSGSYGTFKNEAKIGNNYASDLGVYPDEKKIVSFLDTDLMRIDGAPDASVPYYYVGSYILTNVSIDSNGKLSYSQVIPRNWLHDNIDTNSDESYFWLTYYTNGNSYVGYLPIAEVSGETLDSYKYKAGILNKKLLEKYETKFNDISSSYNNLSSYVETSYSYLNKYLDNTISYIDKNLSDQTSYIKNYIDNNVLIDSITAYSSRNSTYLAYNINDKYYATYFKAATTDNQGPLSAYTYNYFDNHVTDIEERLSGKEITKSLQSPQYEVKWTVYKADSTTELGNFINTQYITVERGCYVKADDMTITWPKSSNYMTPLYTTGSWGNQLYLELIRPEGKNYSVVIDSNNNNYTTDAKKAWSKRQITNWTSTNIYQTITGITTYGAKSLIAKPNSIGTYVLQRQDAKNTQSTSKNGAFYINVSQPINYWYGFTTENPANWTEGENITDLLMNTIEKTTNNGKSCFTYGTKDSKDNKGNLLSNNARITIINNSPITLNNTTSGAPGYFIYIYRTEYGLKLSSAILNDSTDVTGAFSFGLQKKVKITSRTNGYVQEYWVLWSSGVNSINWPTKFDLK